MALPRFLVQVMVVGSQIVGRAFAQALRQEFRTGTAARQRASETGQKAAGTKSAAANSLSGMSLQEAKQILNVELLDHQQINEKFEHLFKVNDRAQGGSFYLQSKVYRAKERLDMELKTDASNDHHDS
ncbi:mitochondrial import inner membrane translocase subunit TIM16-like [Corticium candelabrum]|uniref:mitochondrial import inner membrane translocase subunit TIM16-like n=1 Tax=Corticium candelabrum TaxID=121492 RepID=UPI002E26108A|nr:mitochondrial import inner membrane translocase subunit TIM16-like [Corticium candelabrum]